MKTAWLRQFGPLLLACVTAIGTGCGGETCETNSCSGHGTCDDSSGSVTCACGAAYTGAACEACAAGFQDNDANGECLDNCASAGLHCGSRGTCSDASGTAVCDCQTGWAGASCGECAGGYHSQNDICVVDTFCEAMTCSGHGACDDSAGQPVCACDAGYELPSCGTCTAGYQDNNHDGNCLPTCARAELTCGSHGSCSDASGTAACVCQQPYAGATCQACMAGFQDNDHDGTCLESCSTAGLSCANGTCNDSSGEAACVCNSGYQDNDHNGSCLPTCTTAGLTCSNHGTCRDTSGTATCSCSTGYTGTNCAGCAPGYVSSNGSCIQQPSGTGETCSNAIVLPLVTGTVSGNTTGSGDDYQPGCVSSDSSERVYTFQVTGSVHVAFETSGFDTVMYVRSSCNGSDLGCNDDLDGSNRGSRLEGDLTTGTYYLFVDGYETTGAYTLSVEVTTNCGAGQIADGQGGCVDDPCSPNPCTQVPDKTQCVVELPSSYHCACRAGYIDNGSGGCMVDTNTNAWTFFVFLNGDNNLASDARADVGEMGDAGSNSYVHIVVLRDFEGSSDSDEVLVTNGGTQVIRDLGEVDMGNWTTLRDFGVWAVNTYPARHYAMVMWDHGDGWKAAPKPLEGIKAFSNDDNGNYNGISISNGDYARAMQAITAAAGGKLDLVGFDACLMGMYEVAKATAPYAHYLVASEETEPSTGWGYDRFLPGLVSNHSMDALALGSAIADAYYNTDSESATLAVTDLDTMPALDAAISSFATQLRSASSSYSSIDTVRNASQAFYTEDHIDLWDFANRISQNTSFPQALRSSATALKTQLDQSIVYNRSHYSGAHGLAIYLPSRNGYFDSDYVGSGATWSTATTWDEFLQAFTQ